MQKELQKLGLSNKEIKVYLALLSIGRAPVSVLCYRTEMTRNGCRYICQQLVDKKLVVIKEEGNVHLYEAEPPEKFKFLINQEKKVLQDKERAFDSILDELKFIMCPEIIIPTMRTYHDKLGIISIYEDMLSTGEDIYAWTDMTQIYETLGDYMYTFIEKRVVNNITTHAIMPKTQLALQHDNEQEKRKVKFVGNLPIDGEIRIYGTKIAIITLHKKSPVGFVLESDLVAKTLRSIFLNEWKEF